MRMKLSENPRPEVMIAAVRNSEASAAIPKGTPLVLNLSLAAQPTTAGDGFGIGYEDGLQVVLPATAGANPSLNFAYGVALDVIPNGQLGEAILFGVCNYALVVGQTRAASTDAWTSSASSSSAGGYILVLDTVNNSFKRASATAPAAGPVNAILLDALPASTNAAASATSDTRLAILYSARVFVRMM